MSHETSLHSGSEENKNIRSRRAAKFGHIGKTYSKKEQKGMANELFSAISKQKALHNKMKNK